jgi:hypothetical protein
MMPATENGKAGGMLKALSLGRNLSDVVQAPVAEVKADANTQLTEFCQEPREWLTRYVICDVVSVALWIEAGCGGEKEGACESVFPLSTDDLVEEPMA